MLQATSCFWGLDSLYLKQAEMTHCVMDESPKIISLPKFMCYKLILSTRWLNTGPGVRFRLYCATFSILTLLKLFDSVAFLVFLGSRPWYPSPSKDTSRRLLWTSVGLYNYRKVNFRSVLLSPQHCLLQQHKHTHRQTQKVKRFLFTSDL